jgi:branched-chain amino acid transport system permease protein
MQNDHRRFHTVRSTIASWIGLAALLPALGILALAPCWSSPATMRLLIEFFHYLVLASLWNLLAGYAGLVSVGQQAFVGLGGYTMFGFALFLGINPLFGLLLAGLAAGALAIPTALVIFRLRGPHFAIGTWVVAEVYRLVFAQVAPLGGGSGASLPVAAVRAIAASREMRERLLYWIALIIAVGTIGIIYLFLRSRWGLALTAIRDNERAAESLGVDNSRVKFVVYVLTAALTGLVGAMIFLQKLRISPDAAFSVNDWTAFVIFIVVIGGIGRMEGPIIGTVVFLLLRQLFADLGTWYLIILGSLAVAVMLLTPAGLWGFVAGRFGLQLFPVQRKLVPLKS